MELIDSQRANRNRAMRHLRRAADLIGQTAFGANSSDAHNPSDWPDVPKEWPKEGDEQQDPWYNSYDVKAPGDEGQYWRELEDAEQGDIKNMPVYIPLRSKYGNVYVDVGVEDFPRDQSYGQIFYGELSKQVSNQMRQGATVVLRMVTDQDKELIRSKTSKQKERLQDVLAGGWLIRPLTEDEKHLDIWTQGWLNFENEYTEKYTNRVVTVQPWTHVTMDDRTLRRLQHFAKVNYNNTIGLLPIQDQKVAQQRINTILGKTNGKTKKNRFSPY